MVYQKWIILILLMALAGCSDQTQKASYEGFSKDELQFISKFDHNLLNRMARRSLSIERKEVSSVEEIRPLQKKQVKPEVYSQLFSTGYMEKDHQKQVFIAQILPQVLITKYYLHQQKEVLEMLISEDTLVEGNQFDQKQEFIERQMRKYGANNAGELVERLTTHPTSLILAQAAIESNWGSTRSYAQANNPFHIISEDSTDPRIKTFDQDGSVVYLKKYRDLPAAIADYFRNINRAERLAEFRRERQSTDDPLTLAQYLDDYTNKYGKAYTKRLTNMIRQNGLTRYDNYEIDSSYINILTKNEIQSIIEENTEREKNIVDGDASRIRKIQSRSVDIQYKSIGNPEDIVEVNSKYVVPNVYTNVIDLKYLPLKEKKEKFIDMLLPSVLTAAHGIEQTRERLEAIRERKRNGQAVAREDSLFLEKQLRAWKADSLQTLLNEKLITRPNSIMLAQAALETGWGSSRFFVAANNTFGVWSFDEDESRIQAHGTRDGTPVYVKKYDNLSASIIDYYKVIARGPYDEYREARKRTRDPYQLVEYLYRYSELGQEYINRLKTVMRKADMKKYDDYQLDPTYIKRD